MCGEAYRAASAISATVGEETKRGCELGEEERTDSAVSIDQRCISALTRQFYTVDVTATPRQSVDDVTV